MQEKSLLKLALICAIIGLVVLFIFSKNMEISETNIEKITLEQAGNYVKVLGRIKQVTDTEKVMILTITQPKDIQVVLFKDNDISLEEGQYIEILGKIEEYRGKPEIIANRVRLID